MINRDMTLRKATAYLSVFWLTFTTARLIAAFTMPEGKDLLALTALTVGCVICTVVLALSQSAETTLVTVVAIALLMAPIFPILIPNY